MGSRVGLESIQQTRRRSCWLKRTDHILAFTESLSNAEMPSESLHNIYHEPLRQRNLIRWLDRAESEELTMLFIGEAPGRYGAAITGVPFTSVENLKMLDKHHQNAFAEDCYFEIPEREGLKTKESTSTIFWQCVSSLLSRHPLVMAWNVVPFWPVDNRTPNAAEIRFGSKWLREIVEMYPTATIVAVGKRAETALEEIGTEHVSVRHPAHGGKTDFYAGVKHVAQSLMA